MSDSVRPHRRQPTRLPRPWDSPGKNTGVGCHFLLQCTKVQSESEVAQLCLTQRPHGLQPTRLLRSWDFPGKSTRVGCHCLLLERQKPGSLVIYFALRVHVLVCVCVCVCVCVRIRERWELSKSDVNQNSPFHVSSYCHK